MAKKIVKHNDELNEKAYDLFNRSKALQVASIIQNPDFIIKEDLRIFMDNKDKLVKDFINNLENIEKLAIKLIKRNEESAKELL